MLPHRGHRKPPGRATRALLFRRILSIMADPNTKPLLMAREERLWTELHDLVDSLPEGEVARPGYFAEGWSAKDLIAHVGSWLAEAGVVLERMRSGTYRSEELDIDS